MPAMSTVPTAIRRRLLVTLFAGQSLFSAAQIVAFAVLPIVAVELAGTETVAGLPATVTLVGRAIAAYPVGWLMDRYGRRFGLSIGFLLATLGALLSALAVGWATFAGLLLGTLLSGMGRGISEQARFAAAEVETPDRRANAIGWIVFAGTIGAVLGPRLMVPAEQFAIRFGFDPATGPFVFSAALAYAALMCTVIFLRPDPKVVGEALAGVTAGENAAALGPGRPVREIFADWSVRLALLAMVVGQLVMTTIMVITPLYMSKNSYDTSAIAWVLMAHTLGMFGLAGVTGWLIDRTSQIAIIVAGSLLLMASAVLAPLATNVPVLALALFLLGLGWSFCFIAGSSLLSNALLPHERGRVQGASETLVSLAAGVGSLSTGVIFVQGGITGISAAGLAVSLVLLVATVWTARVHRHELPAVAPSGD
jgi:MFS family permease